MVLAVENLRKSFSNIQVLRKLSLSFREGKVTTVAGPNGVGKSTLIRIILGFVRPDSGIVTIDGFNVTGTFRYRSGVGYMQQKPEYPENLTVKEILALAKDLRGYKDEPDMELFHEFKFGTEADKKFKELSGGNKQKVNAILSFMFRPSLIILDEPTAGLDPYSAVCLKNKIHSEKTNGKTIILTTHHHADIKELTDDIVFLKDGNVVYAHELATLLNEHHGESLEAIMAHYFKA